MMLLLNAIVRFVDGGCCRCRCRCYWACAFAVVVVYRIVVLFTRFHTPDSTLFVRGALHMAQSVRRIFYDEFSFIWTLLCVWCWFDEQTARQTQKKICVEALKWKVCTHTSKPSAKNFIDFDFIVPYCVLRPSQLLRCVAFYIFARCTTRHSITAVAHRKLQSCCRMKIFVKCQ